MKKTKGKRNRKIMQEKSKPAARKPKEKGIKQRKRKKNKKG